MLPKYFGKGTWIFIFYLIYKINDIEILKKLLFYYCTSLPCIDCSNHARNNILQNNILETQDVNVVLHFFMDFFNQFYVNNKINRNDFNKDFMLNKDEIFNNIFFHILNGK